MFGQLDFMPDNLIETLIVIGQADCTFSVPYMTVHAVHKGIASSCSSFPEENSNFSEGDSRLSYVTELARS